MFILVIIQFSLMHQIHVRLSNNGIFNNELNMILVPCIRYIREVGHVYHCTRKLLYI